MYWSYKTDSSSSSRAVRMRQGRPERCIAWLNQSLGKLHGQYYETRPRAANVSTPEARTTWRRRADRRAESTADRTPNALSGPARSCPRGASASAASRRRPPRPGRPGRARAVRRRASVYRCRRRRHSGQAAEWQGLPRPQNTGSMTLASDGIG